MVREILLPSFPVALPLSACTEKPLKWYLMPKAFRLLILLFAFPLRLFSQEPVASPTPTVTMEDLQLLQSTLKWKHGKIPLGSDLATIDVPASFRYLDPKDAESVLVKMWGNPPQEAKHILGMIFPDDVGPLDQNSWGVVITYIESGYVKDDDAKKINYDELLAEIQKATKEANEERSRQGYPTIDVLGWAEVPYYDEASHKLYWAKELKFGGMDINTLNYCIRDLGRRGVIQLNAVATMTSLAEIKERMPTIISMVDFNPGNKYTDFNPSTDKTSELGIAALILGGTAAAAKFGLFKWLFALVIAGKKFILLGLVAIAAFFRKIFGVFKRKTPKMLPSTPGGPSPE
jgi:uncharacterized membrane-anchored protein